MKTRVKVKRLMKIAQDIVQGSLALRSLTDAELRNKTDEFKQRYQRGETLEDLLPEAFAVCAEASWRTLRMRPYPVQVVGGIVLHSGSIAEMRTGEGKTLVATLPAYLNAITGKGVHVVTVNDYLAKRDSEWMGKVFRFLGMTVGLITQGGDPKTKKAAYACDITYCTNTELGFDYLRDNMVHQASDRVMRGYHFAIIDEVDSILIDEARTPMIISGFADESSEEYAKADTFVKGLNGILVADLSEDAQSKMDAIFEGVEDPYEKYSQYDYVAEEKQHTAVLTEAGEQKMYDYYALSHDDPNDESVSRVRYYVSVALKANTLYKKDVDYIVTKGGISIIDLGTGRVMPGRRFSNGIHQGLEAKEGVAVRPEMITVASATYQNFFRLYDRISGMTGTAMTEAEEFLSIYGLPVIEIPTNKPVVRKDQPDLVFVSARARLEYLIQLVEERHATGQPILVGTSSVEKSELIHRVFMQRGIPHTVLNAKNHEKEAEIVAQAGRIGSVTIATNMAGRGTDIILGGNPEFLALQYFKNAGYPEALLAEMTEYSETDDEEIRNARKAFAEKKAAIKAELAADAQKVLDLGGLFVIGTERHVSRRIDNQLRGRAGRQGDQGESIFLLSLEDDLMRLFGADRVASLVRIGLPEDQPIDAKILSGVIERAQANVEASHFAQRKRTLDYDVINAMVRDSIYEQRNAILDKETSADFQSQYLSAVNTYLDYHIEPLTVKKKISDGDKEKLMQDLQGDFLHVLDGDWSLVAEAGNKATDVRKACETLLLRLIECSDRAIEILAGSDVNAAVRFKRASALDIIDRHWRDMMEDMEDIRDDASLAMMANNDPLTRYKIFVNQAFEVMKYNIAKQLLRHLAIAVRSAEQAGQTN